MEDDIQMVSITSVIVKLHFKLKLNYTNTGVEKQCVDSEQREDPGRCVVWAYDVYGWQSPGRGFEMVDLLNAKTGMIVIYPDFFRGEQNPEPETFRWETKLKARLKRADKHIM